MPAASSGCGHRRLDYMVEDFVPFSLTPRLSSRGAQRLLALAGTKVRRARRTGSTAGETHCRYSSAVGVSIVPSGLAGVLLPLPNVETLGYFRQSLRDKIQRLLPLS